MAGILPPRSKDSIQAEKIRRQAAQRQAELRRRQEALRRAARLRQKQAVDRSPRPRSREWKRGMFPYTKPRWGDRA